MQKAVSTQIVASAVILPFTYCMKFIPPPPFNTEVKNGSTTTTNLSTQTLNAILFTFVKFNTLTYTCSGGKSVTAFCPDLEISERVLEFLTHT